MPNVVNVILICDPIFRSSPKIIKSEAATRVGKSQTERSVYFEAGEEGGEVKLVPASEAGNKVTAEPSSGSGPLPGPRHGMAGSFPLEQAKNVDNFSVRYTFNIYENESDPSLLNLFMLSKFQQAQERR